MLSQASLSAAKEPALQDLIQAAPQAQSPPAATLRPQAIVVDEASSAGARAEGIGLSHSGDPFDIPHFSLEEVARLLRRAGGTHYRPHVPLKEARPELSQGDLDRLERAARDPALLDSMIDDLSRNGRWERIDALVRAFTGEGVKLMLVVGAGYRKEAPVLIAADGTKSVVSPGRIGRERYVTMVRWLVGAAARRYASRVEFWQAENEINVAGAVVANGWRVGDPSWFDVAFLKRLVAAISGAVHAEGKRQGLRLKTAHNFATNMPWQNYVLGTADVASDIGNYAASADLDVIGVDLYANYFVGWPLRDKSMAHSVAMAVQAAGGRPVWVLETGFANGPSERDFNDARQAAYFRKMFDECYAAGAKVVLAFGWFWDPRGWYTDSPKPLPWWNPMAQEQYWSPIHVSVGPDGSEVVRFGPAWDAFEKAASAWVGSSAP